MRPSAASAQPCGSLLQSSPWTVALTGSTSREFEEQVGELQPFLNENWKARVSEKTGNPIYERPVVLVLYREDHRFLLDPIIPHPGRAEASIGQKETKELAVMMDSFRALKVAAPALSFEDPDYHRSWIEAQHERVAPPVADTGTQVARSAESAAPAPGPEDSSARTLDDPPAPGPASAP